MFVIDCVQKSLSMRVLLHVIGTCVKSDISNNPVFTKHYTRSITNVCVVHWNTDNDNDLITEVTHNIRERIKLQLEV